MKNSAKKTDTFVSFTLGMFLLAILASVAEGRVMPPDRAKQLQAKGYHTETAEQIIEATKSESYFVRFIALELLTERIGKEAIPTLEEALNDPKLRVRWTAAHLLGTLGDKSGLEQMRRDLTQLTNKGAPVPPDPSLTEEQNRKRDTKRNYRLLDALNVAKVLAELEDYSGYALAARMAIEGPLEWQRWRAVVVLVEIAKADKAKLQKDGLDPVFVLKAVAGSEKVDGVSHVLTNLVEKELDDDTAIEILEIAKNSTKLSEGARRVAQIQLDKVKARKRATVEKNQWYPDAPYLHYMQKYEQLIASTPKPEDFGALSEEFKLASYLAGEHFKGWSNIFGDDPKGKDQFERALKLYEHIVRYYPRHEYKVLMAKVELAGLTLNLKRDVKTAISEYIDIFTIPAEAVVDSTDQSRNRALKEGGGETQAQADFERHLKARLRARIIELCRSRGPTEQRTLLAQILEKCSGSDPEIVRQAGVALEELTQNGTERGSAPQD